jgi:hypothetical protein
MVRTFPSFSREVDLTGHWPRQERARARSLPH